MLLLATGVSLTAGSVGAEPVALDGAGLDKIANGRLRSLNFSSSTQATASVAGWAARAHATADTATSTDGIVARTGATARSRAAVALEPR
ncbi:MAG: hypothetical protein RMK73_14665 [Geminicoccaceae bacterium]|nr:hypothetical protein [Geminicoccaceae bacterium]MCS7267828.1 hypothetical protein [Geminicoccaceae bacterium]MDW8342723.1 hypothetical protein [Geminicoccaceae bacterium]